MPDPEHGHFQVVILSGLEPRILERLIAQIHAEVPATRVCGILYHTPARRPARQRLRKMLSNLRDRVYLQYAVVKALSPLRRGLKELGRYGLGLFHAYLPGADETPCFGLAELEKSCRSRGCPILVTTDMHSEDALAFVRDLRPDLGVVYGTPILKPKLFEIPRLGSINLHQRKVPGYRGGGPIGLWELLDGETELGVTVHRVVKQVNAGGLIRSGTIPIEPYDSLSSLALKAHVVGIDLLAQTIADFARGEVREIPQEGPSRTFRSPSLSESRRYRKQLAAARPAYAPPRGRPLWKLAARILVFGPRIAVRNWYRRLTGTFPVTVLYHHLVSDRPHFLGISTDHFVKHLEFLRRHYKVVDLGTARQMLRSDKIHVPIVVLTLDDGYRDNYTPRVRG
jgi:folate-dependent phosphoribosylglycinamide formyltransferase PurN